MSEDEGLAERRKGRLCEGPDSRAILAVRMMLELPVAAGQVIAGKYRLDRVIGSGGMGVVVAAWHLELEQPVAIKFLNVLDVDRTDAIERFRREARAAARIRSEHVARVIDVGVTEERLPFMVMEFLEGNDLAEEILRRGMVPVPVAVGYLLQAIEALAEAHAGGIVHRDLKPANLFLSERPDGTRFVKVLDFGISKSLTKSSSSDLALTKTSVLVGSPLYMSPEHMRSAKDVDLRTDIWSLGAILYELLTGRPPYIADSIPQLWASMLSDRPPPMADFCSDLPEGLETVVLRCLEKDASKRFQNVSELANALVAFSPVARVHAERARRVLGSADVLLNGVNALEAGVFASGAMPQSSARPTHGEKRLNTPSNPTFASWGGTGAVGERRRKRRRSALVVAGAGLVAVGCALLIARRMGHLSFDATLQTPAASGTVMAAYATTPVESKADPPPETARAERPLEPVPPPSGATALPRASSASGSSTAPGSASALASAEPRSAVPRPTQAPQKSLFQKPRAAAVQATPGARDALPDFGGRR